MHPFTSAEAANPEFSHLIRKSGNAYTFAADGYDPYFSANINITKEIGDYVSLSLNAINFTNSRPYVKSHATGVSALFTPISIMDLLAVSNSNYMKQFIYILLLTVTGIFAGCTGYR